MSEMISVASGFQYSVNIGYDLNNDAKLKNFIPTQSALQLLSDVLDSTAVTSTERSRILIGAYGKGKSHIVLMILSMLLKKDLSLFEKTMPKISENPRLLQSVHNYKQKGSTSALKPFASGSARTASATAFFFKISECQVKSLRLLCRPGCFVKEVSMISTSRNKIDETVAPDEIETYVSIPSCLLQGCSNDLIIFRADGGNHFTHYGIYEGMFLIFDVSKDFKEGRLSCYLNNSGDDRPKFKVSDKPLDGYRHFGRLVASMKNYEV